MTADACPAAAQIVGHKIDEVEVLRRACPVLPCKRIRRAGCAGRQRFPAGAERTVHGGAKLCQQQNEVFAVFRIRASDDCLNAANSDLSGFDFSMDISGGTISAYTTDGDGFDSNGSMTISGGTPPEKPDGGTPPERPDNASEPPEPGNL